MAVRLALGATPRSIQARWLWLALRLAMIGTAIGLPVGVVVSRLTSELAFEVGSRYPLLLALTTMLLLVTAVAAGIPPSVRASRMDVMKALRGD